jgi:hypothetical protein
MNFGAFSPWLGGLELSSRALKQYGTTKSSPKSGRLSTFGAGPKG